MQSGEIDMMRLAECIKPAEHGYHLFCDAMLKPTETIVSTEPDLPDRAMRAELSAGIAEWLDSAEWASCNGCQELQGYMFGKPMPGTEVEAFLRAQGPAARQSQPDRTLLQRSA
jgi:predicted signal transduction protein with EAL and GGDEF domain